MATKTVLSGTTATIDTGIKMTTFEKVAKNKPEALILRDKESEKELFRISVGTGNCLNQNGMAVKQIGNNLNAVVTVDLADVEPKRREKFLVENYTGPDMMLNKTLEQVVEASSIIKAAQKKFTEALQTADAPTKADLKEE